MYDVLTDFTQQQQIDLTLFALSSDVFFITPSVVSSPSALFGKTSLLSAVYEAGGVCGGSFYRKGWTERLFRSAPRSYQCSSRAYSTRRVLEYLPSHASGR